MGCQEPVTPDCEEIAILAVALVFAIAAIIAYVALERRSLADPAVYQLVAPSIMSPDYAALAGAASSSALRLWRRRLSP
jgi:hypothetical protein